jgi:hypothetical protein
MTDKATFDIETMFNFLMDRYQNAERVLTVDEVKTMLKEALAEDYPYNIYIDIKGTC